MSSKHSKRPSTDDETVISLERKMCLGPCPVYSLMIFSDGKVVYHGKEYVRVKGLRKYRVPKYKVKQLIEHFNKIGYFDLKDVYEPITTDGPACITAISINGHTKRVAHWLPSVAPDWLSELEEMIDKTAGSAKFVKLDKYLPEPGIWG